jgi:outer membrane protein assembly factor BamB
MPITAASPPVRVPIVGGFDYVTVDAQRRRVYAAHGGNRSLMIVDADTGQLLGQVRVGPMAGSAIDPVTGHVYTGNGEGRSVSEVDPVAMKVLRSVDLPGDVDAIAYDPAGNRIYADEDNGTHIYVVDAKTFAQIGTIDLPGHKPEYLAVDDARRVLYQNISDQSEVVTIDLATSKIVRSFPMPGLQATHPLQYDPVYDYIIVGGANGVLASYKPDGTQMDSIAVPARIDQCTLDNTRHLVACAGGSKITLVKETSDGKLAIVGQIDVARGMHTVAIDSKTGDIWGVWAAKDGDWVQRFSYKE